MSTSTSNLGLVKPDGPDRALVAVINENMNKIDQYAGEVNDSLGAVEDGMAIVADGNTHAAITSGQFVYVRNHSTLTQGLYTATANIAANATLSTSNLTADPSGGLNALNSNTFNNTVKTGNALTTLNDTSLIGYYNAVKGVTGAPDNTYYYEYSLQGRMQFATRIDTGTTVDLLVRVYENNAWCSWYSIKSKITTIKTASIEKTPQSSYADFQWNDLTGKDVLSIHVYAVADGDTQYMPAIWSWKKSTRQLAFACFDIGTGNKQDLSNKKISITAWYIDEV